MRKRKALLTGICMLFCVLFAGCGKEIEDYTAGSASLEYYDISSTREEVFQSWEEEEKGVLLGMQYYKGELVQIRRIYGEGENSVYLCRTDGSRELLKQGAQAELTGRWYLEEDGSVYCWRRSLEVQSEENAPYIQKLNGEGEEVFRREFGQGILLWDLCRMEDSSVLLLLQEGQGGEMKLAVMNPANGSLSEKPGVALGQSPYTKYIAAGSQGVLVLDPETPAGITEISMQDGSVFSAISFLGTSYSLEDGPEEMEVRGFRMQEEGEAEILWADPVSGRGIRELLRLTKMKKTPIILETTLLMDGGWLEKRAAEFNRSNSSYQVVVQYPDPEDQVDFGTKMALRMYAGKGPDILYGDALQFVQELAAKGGLEDLSSYMEKSGIQEEDYYPYAFSCWRDGEKIYTFRLRGTPGFTCIRKELLGGREVSDIEALLDALLDWEGEAFFNIFPSSEYVLGLLANSDYWGMIDWENGVCDFSGELFAKMLKAAKKYGVSWERAVAGDFPVGYQYPIKSINCSFYGYKTSAELEEMGLARLSTLMGQESHSGIAGVFSVLAINANSVQKEGAWEFIRYLMGEEVQRTFTNGDMTNKQVHREWIAKELSRLQKDGIGMDLGRKAMLSNGEIIIEEDINYTKEDITQERIDEYLNMLENTTEINMMERKRIQLVDEIIEEEAEYYFEGVKSLEEVVDIINSRVRLYIGEQH